MDEYGEEFENMWDMNLVLIRSQVVDCYLPAGIEGGKNFRLIFSQFLDSPLMDA